jgi:ribosome-associated protein
MFPESILSEISFKTSRSSGPGGQNVNKVATKVQLYFDIPNSPNLSSEQKELLLQKLSNKITKNGVLYLSNDTSRSQQANKELVINQFKELIYNALKPVKKRKKTHKPHSANLKRLEKKKRHSEIKARRKKLF